MPTKPAQTATKIFYLGKKGIFIEIEEQTLNACCYAKRKYAKVKRKKSSSNPPLSFRRNLFCR